MKRGPLFGDKVIVQAETVRVIGKLDKDGAPAFTQSWSTRDAGRYVKHDFPDARTWPGIPLELPNVKVSERWVLEPEPDGPVYVRLRRIVPPLPEVGVVVGYSWKEEGVVRVGRGDDSNFLTGPDRGRVPLIEVALPSKAKARIVLVHVDDASVLASAARVMA